MQDDYEMNQHFVGTFNIRGEKIDGELIRNESSGVTLLNLMKPLNGTFAIGNTYGNLDVITGVLNSGTTVTLFHNRCTQNFTQAFQTQQLVFVADYSIWSGSDATNGKYNELVCVLENALEWSGLSTINTNNVSEIKFKGNENENVYHWFGSKITFSTSLTCELFSTPRKEESKIIERLVVHIEAEGKQDPSYFIAIRNKITSLIPFAIKDNVNIEEQY